MFVFPIFILGDNFDALFYCEHPRNPCLLDDAFPSCGWTWDFHPCHLSFIDFIFDSWKHWAQKNLPRRLERVVWIWPHLGDMYFMMENLSMFRPSLEGEYFYVTCMIQSRFMMLLVSFIVPSMVMVS